MDSQKILSIENDILERKEIIEKYYSTGILDREEAIRKIRELRTEDTKVAEITAIKLFMHGIPFENANNEQIIEDLRMQVDILTGELFSNY